MAILNKKECQVDAIEKLRSSQRNSVSIFAVVLTGALYLLANSRTFGTTTNHVLIKYCTKCQRLGSYELLLFFIILYFDTPFRFTLQYTR